MGSQHALREAMSLALGRWRLALSAIVVLLGLFILVPILLIFPMAVTADTFLTWPPDIVSFRWFRNFAESPVWVDPLVRSFEIAVPVAVIATTLGTLAALGCSRIGRGRRWIQTLFVAPMVLPLITYALGIYDIAGRLDLSGSIWPVVIGQTMLAMPLVFIIVSAALAYQDPQLPQAAASLGARAFSILWRIELPLLRPSIVAGALIALAYSFDEIIVAYFLLPAGEATLPVQILSSTRESADPTIAAASVVVIGVGATIAATIGIARALLTGRST